MTLEEAQGPGTEVWPDNLQAVNVFVCMSTQWRVGMNGATGLDYGPVYKKMDRLGLTPAEYDCVEDDIRTLEDAALETIRKNKK